MKDKCAIDHILDAQKKGEISEDNVLYIVENINVTGNYFFLPFFLFLYVTFIIDLSSPTLFIAHQKKSAPFILSIRVKMLDNNRFG